MDREREREREGGREGGRDGRREGGTERERERVEGKRVPDTNHRSKVGFYKKYVREKSLSHPDSIWITYVLEVRARALSDLSGRLCLKMNLCEVRVL